MSNLRSAAYLEYLDKEMTIMGILSAFAITLSAVLLERCVSAKAGTELAQLWLTSGSLIAGASASALVAALLFYLERSLLAWYYGQLVLREIEGSRPKVDELLHDADAWATWVRYQLGFVALYLSFALVGAAVLRRFSACAATVSASNILVPFASIAVLYSVVTRQLLRKYRFEDDHPFVFLWKRRCGSTRQSS